MQGWRKTQEDAHTALLDYDENGSAFFAVFDGHGGEEVSKYCSIHLPSFIKETQSELYHSDLVEALKKAFLQFDRELKRPDVINQLRKLVSLDEMEEIAENESTILRKEALMPLEEVMKSSFPELYSNENKNGETSENNKEDATSDNKIDESTHSENAPGEKENNKVSDSSSNGDGSKKDIDPGPSTSSSLKSAKDQAMKILNKTIYEAFLQDFDSDDDDSSEDENSLEDDDSSEDDDDDIKAQHGSSDEDDDEEDEEEEEDDDLPESDFENPFSNVHVSTMPGGGSGCTAIVAIIKNNTLYVANVGDSRAVLSREGKAIEMSEDHKPEDDLEKQRILKAGGEVTIDGRVNGGLNLSRAIGDHIYKRNDSLPDEEQMVTALPDIRTYELDPEKDQFLFLACDGIWNSMSSQEAVDFINEKMKENMSSKKICEALFETCLAPNTNGDGSGCDNMTCILVKFKKSSDSKRSLDDLADHSEPPTKKGKTSVDTETDMFKPGPSNA
ncbi:hypothetical protein RDWZM_009187 [Blomia tropicalis]|uniref:protein-serine/threonine phosphatase n=1 Tax=Blomia tropicalis TaxID=40697 RepID=A0A9Q0M629_BLOTA|nr:hypothetical protein RDWZM_009187 [Blomia tropicalis]